ncbi:hypothetical protein D3C78_1758230 [compost metagenome]
MITLLAVLVHRAEQAFEMILEHLLEAFQVIGLLHAALQAVHLFANLGVHFPGSRQVIRVVFTGGLQAALE